MTYTLHTGDCRDVMATLPAESVDAIVCDPPYGLSFMGNGWDHGVPGVDFWVEALRVLKPGGHLIAFGGTRTYHRLAVAIEDAGFEVRDCLMWLYGSGFPKSLDVSKAMDKQKDNREEIARVVHWLENARIKACVSRAEVETHFGTVNIGQGFFTVTEGSKPRVPTWNQWLELKKLLSLNDEMDKEVWRLNGLKGKPSENFKRREVIGHHDEKSTPGGFGENRFSFTTKAITAPNTELAKEWQGWGTALKPAYEPAILARKPLRGTVSDNVAQWGTGGLNIDGCRVGDEVLSEQKAGQAKIGTFERHNMITPQRVGRWPANVILDEEAAAALDEQSGVTKSGKPGRRRESSGLFGLGGDGGLNVSHGDSGGASRFFYTAKASRSEREIGLQGGEKKLSGVKALRDNDRANHPRANHHPTVKPIALMRYMIRLVAPRGAVVLDPFMGSGSTGCAAMVEGMQFIGIDITPEYIDIARRRLAWWSCQLDNTATMELDNEEEPTP